MPAAKSRRWKSFPRNTRWNSALKIWVANKHCLMIWDPLDPGEGTHSGIQRRCFAHWCDSRNPCNNHRFKAGINLVQGSRPGAGQYGVRGRWIVFRRDRHRRRRRNTGNTSTSEFTKILQDALEPALKTVVQSNPKTAEPVASPARGVTKTGPVEVEALKESTDGKATGTDVVREARKYLGVPYVWGGNDPKIGLDCSSFVQHAFRDLGVDLPRVARDQAKVGTEIPSLAQAKPGDLIVTRNGAHIGIYLGENKMIHAPRPGEQVSIRKLFETDAQIMTIRRIVPAESPAPAATKTVAESQVREASSRAAELTASAQRAAFNSVVKDS